MVSCIAVFSWCCNRLESFLLSFWRKNLCFFLLHIFLFVCREIFAYIYPSFSLFLNINSEGNSVLSSCILISIDVITILLCKYQELQIVILILILMMESRSRFLTFCCKAQLAFLNYNTLNSRKMDLSFLKVKKFQLTKTNSSFASI